MHAPQTSDLAATRFVETDSEAIRAFAADHARSGSDREKAVRLYLAVRDGIRYDPYSFRLDPARYAASACLAAGTAFCVPKAILLAAAARAMGIPARLGFADVRNHLTSPRLSALMGSDLFRWHGYTSLWLGGKWVKATPAFDIALCRRFGVAPLDFDGHEDSVFHAFDGGGRRHMEYVRDIGEFDDFPYDLFATDMRRHYAPLIAALEERDRLKATTADPTFPGNSW